MVAETDRQDAETMDENPVKTVTKDALLKLHRVSRKPPTEAQARIVRGGEEELPRRHSW